MIKKGFLFEAFFMVTSNNNRVQ